MVIQFNIGSRYEHDATELALTPSEWCRIPSVRRCTTLYGLDGAKFVIRRATEAELKVIEGGTCRDE